MSIRTWTREELLIAINFYCKTPFGKFHQRNPEIITLSKILNRSPSSLAMKLCNFASLDPAQKLRQIKGLNKVSKLDREVWDEFNSNWEKMAFESEISFKKLSGDKHVYEFNYDNTESELPTETRRLTRVRLVQSFFRRTILANYESKCSFCGIKMASLLIASHIIPWSNDVKRRADPRNGICLCALHDRAFDVGILAIDDSFRILVSSKAKSIKTPKLMKVGILEIEGQKIDLPARFDPDPAAIEFHRKNIFKFQNNEKEEGRF